MLVATCGRLQPNYGTKLKNVQKISHCMYKLIKGPTLMMRNRWPNLGSNLIKDPNIVEAPTSSFNSLQEYFQNISDWIHILFIQYNFSKVLLHYCNSSIKLLLQLVQQFAYKNDFSGPSSTTNSRALKTHKVDFYHQKNIKKTLKISRVVHH